MDSLSTILQEIEERRVFALDVEAESTTSDSSDVKIPRLARITYVSLASPSFCGSFKITDEVKAAVVQLLSRSDLTCVVHYWPYDGQAMHYNGWINFTDIKATKIDTTVLSWLIDEENDHGLKSLVYQYFKYRMATYSEVTSSSPSNTELAYCRFRLNRLPETVANWEKKRPYPTFSDDPISKPKIRKALLADGVITDKKAIKKEITRLFSDEELQAFKQFAATEDARLRTKIATLLPLIEREFREYSKEDAKYLMKLYGKLIRQVTSTVDKKWLQVECAMRNLTIEMEITGISIDTTKLNELKEFLEPLIVEFEANIYNIAKQEFNPSSPQQVSQLLFTTMGIDPPPYRRDESDAIWPKLTPEGERYCLEHNIVLDLRNPSSIPDVVRHKYLSSDKDVLERLAHPIGQAILDYRTVKLLHKNYVVGTLERLELHKDGKLHTRFNPIGADTGRWSSSDPNLQNIPSRAKDAIYDERIQKLGAKLRQMFIAPPADDLAPEGYDLLIADHSQIELRFMAHFTRDMGLLKAYSECVIFNGTRFYTGDIHTITSNSLNIPRKLAKNVNFGRVIHLSRTKTHSIQWNPDRAILSESFRNKRSVQRLTAQTDRLWTGYAAA